MKDFSKNNEIISFLSELGYKKYYFFKTNRPLDLRIRNIFVNFFKIIFMGYTKKIELIDSIYFNDRQSSKIILATLNARQASFCGSS